MIKGITVTLHTREQSGTDDFNRPIYTDGTVNVKNVLVCPTSSEDVVNELNVSGKIAKYTLAIPKADENDWENTTVEFFNSKFRTVGKPTKGIDDLIPGDWNTKVLVEDYE